MIVLVDQDNVLAGFVQGVTERLRRWFSEEEIIPEDQLEFFDFLKNYPDDKHNLIKKLVAEKGLFKNLEPVAGAIPALYEMAELGWDVFICTSPLHPDEVSDYRNCVVEKYLWVERHLGLEWIPHIILTRDKTVIEGDILIDDKPEIVGAAQPQWEHVIFGNYRYNRDVKDKRRIIAWDDWRSVLASEIAHG